MRTIAKEVFEEMGIEYDIEIFSLGEKFLKDYGEREEA